MNRNKISVISRTLLANTLVLPYNDTMEGCHIRDDLKLSDSELRQLSKSIGVVLSTDLPPDIFMSCGTVGSTIDAIWSTVCES